jgi:hypothetical protein
MKSARRFDLIVSLTLVANIFINFPSFAQQDEAAALNARVLYHLYNGLNRGLGR